jgi:hypothetical protein
VKNSTVYDQPQTTTFKVAICLALSVSAWGAGAAENYKLRQSPIGAFGGEIAAGADNPGLFGTASISMLDISSIVDGNGNGIKVPGGTKEFPNGTVLNNPRGGTITLPANHTLKVAEGGTINFHQAQTQVNLVGGYLTEDTYANGRIAFVVNVPLITMSRSFSGALGAASVIPALSPYAAALIGGANKDWDAKVATQNGDVSGVGDTELSAVWIRHQDRLKVAAGVSLFVPTGVYDKTRGPNPGFGNFYTLRPGVAVTYNLNPNHKDASWDAGVTVAGRISYGMNSTNKDTDYRSGNFIYTEVGVVKVAGDWAFGANLLSTQQVTDDTSPIVGTSCLGSVDAAGCRYKTYGVGPFVAYKLPGKDAGFNLQYNENFGGSNAVVVKSWQLRFVKAW